MIYLLQSIKISLLCIFLCFANETYASKIEFSVVPNAVANDTAVIVEARIDPEGESLNAIEGTIGLLGSGVESVSSVIVETGGSIFSLWPTLPEYSVEENVIRFVGGTTEAIQESGLVFRLRIFSKNENTISISWLGGSAYKSDGNGTSEGISSRSLLVSLVKNEPNQINPSSIDSEPPYFEFIEVSQDPDTFDGKYFISFMANDTLSGISRYEVVEDQVVTEVKNGIYVIQNQERDRKIVIIAYDQAGNSSSVKVPTKYQGLVKSVSIFIVVMFICVFLYKYRNRLVHMVRDRR